MDDLARHTLGETLTALGARTPTPGGGAAASLTAALGAALGRMVVNYSVGSKALAGHAELHADALRCLESHERKALDLADADAEAYGRLNALWKLDRADERRTKEFPAAVEGAIDAPRQVIGLCLEVLDVLRQLAGTTKQTLASDLAVAAVLVHAAAKAAAWNVRVNLPLLESEDRATDIVNEVSRLLEEAQHTADAVEASCRTPA